MLLSDPNQTKPLSETTLQGLIKIVDDHVHHLESEIMLAQRSKGMASWIASTKNHLTDLDIQYAFQVEENKKTFNNFLAEIRRAYHLLDLKGSGLILLDNAINEYEQRMYLLLSSGDVIDREISNLITHIDQLKD
jgi:ABC-type Zn2+ transport system substrate-binding protein/surface adhesin